MILKNKEKGILTKNQNKPLDIFFVLDNSNSMANFITEVRSGLEEFFLGHLRDVKESGSPTYISFTVFGSDVSLVTEGEDITQLDLDANEYKADGGMTALLDAIGMTLNSAHFRKAVKSSNSKLLVIQTDGLENYSSKYTREEIAGKIKELEDSEDWTVLFIGEGKGIEAASTIGVQAGSRMSYTGSDTSKVFGSIGRKSAQYRVGKVRNAGNDLQQDLSQNSVNKK